MAGKEEDGYVLYHADPSGTYVRYEAKAIGSGSEGAQGLLQEKYSKDLTLEDALTLAVTVLKQVRPHSIHILPAHRMVNCILVPCILYPQFCTDAHHLYVSHPRLMIHVKFVGYVL